MRAGGAMARVAMGALSIVAGCRPRELRSDDFERAGDAGFVYEREAVGEAGAVASIDAGARPSIEPFAGTPGGRGDLDGVGRAARIGLVAGMARVGESIVFADEGNASMRRFVPATGAVETIARVPSGDGVPSLPAGVAYDGGAKVYFVDRSHHVVYALDLASRRIEVVAGRSGVRGDADGDAASALFDSPTGVALGGRALYVTDVGNRRIRRIDIAARAVSTLRAEFMQPWGLCGSGDALYVTDNLGASILRVDLATGAATLLAGSNRFGYAGYRDGGPREARFREPRGISCEKGALFVADRGSGLVRRVELGSGRVTTLAGRPALLGYRDGQGQEALFRDLQSMLAYGDVVYAGDDGALRAVTARGLVSTAAGTGNPLAIDLDSIERGDMLHPEGIVVAPAEHAAFVAGGASWSVQKIDLATRSTTTFAGNPNFRDFKDDWGTEARFGAVSAIAIDDAGNLFVGDRDNHAVRAVHVASRRVTTVAGTPSKCGQDDGPLDRATFCDPSGLAYSAGSLFVADAGTNAIRRIDLAARAVSTVARVASPVGLVFAAGSLFVADRQGGAVQRVDPASGGAAIVVPARFDRPRGIAVIDDERLLVLARDGAYELSLRTGQATRLVPAGPGVRTASAAPSLGVPVAAAPMAPGDALVVDRNESVVVRLFY